MRPQLCNLEKKTPGQADRHYIVKLLQHVAALFPSMPCVMSHAHTSQDVTSFWHVLHGGGLMFSPATLALSKLAVQQEDLPCMWDASSGIDELLGWSRACTDAIHSISYTVIYT